MLVKPRRPCPLRCHARRAPATSPAHAATATSAIAAPTPIVAEEDSPPAGAPPPPLTGPDTLCPTVTAEGEVWRAAVLGTPAATRAPTSPPEPPGAASSSTRATSSLAAACGRQSIRRHGRTRPRLP